MRLMLGVARVYQIALYVDADAVQNALGLHYKTNTGAESVLNSVYFWRQLQFVRHSLVMHVVREVDGAHLMHGFDRSLSKRMRVAIKKLKMPEAKSQHEQLKKFLKSLKRIPVGSKIRFAILDEGTTVLIEVNGEVLGYIESCPALCYALDDMFLGLNPVSGEAKHSITEGMEHLFS